MILEEVAFYIKFGNVVRITCSMIRIIFRNSIEKRVRRLFFINFQKSAKVCGTNVFAEAIPNLTPVEAFPRKYL